MRTLFHAFLLLLATLTAVTPAFAAGQSLCNQQEEAVFSCKLQSNKYVAACGSFGSAKDDHYTAIQYRFGTPDHIELKLPEDPKQFRHSAFTDEVTNDRPIEDDHYLRFENGVYNYLFYMATGEGFEYKALAVFKNGKLIRKTDCEPNSGEPIQNFNDLLVSGVQGEMTDKQSFAFWKQLLPKNSAVLARHARGLPPPLRHPGK